MKFAKLEKSSWDALLKQFITSVRRITILKSALNIDEYCALCRGQCAGMKQIDSDNDNTKAKKIKERHILKMYMHIETLREDQKNIMKLLTSCVTMEETNVNWDDIVGLESAKSALKESIVFPHTKKQERMN